MFLKICLILVLVNNSIQDNHIKVSVYYESLQNASRWSLITSIMPGYEKLKDEVDFDFDLIPYGRTKQGEGTFNCPEGEYECLLNKMQACTLAQDGTLHNKMMFVKCVMKQDDPLDKYLVNVCIKYWKFDIAQVVKCYEGSHANHLLEGYAKKTALIPAIEDNIPAIVFNDSYDENVSSQARDHFVYKVCEHLKNAPKSCSNLE